VGYLLWMDIRLFHYIGNHPSCSAGSFLVGRKQDTEDIESFHVNLEKYPPGLYSPACQ
jgi:hypothetical protein